jgi:thiamine-phosphate pyrophosphorylase
MRKTADRDARPGREMTAAAVPERPAAAPSSGPSAPFRVPPATDWGIYLVTDRRQAPGQALEQVVAGALRAGVRAIQLREKDLPADGLYRLARRLLTLTRGAGAALLVNDRADVALAAGADGVQLTRKSLPPAEAKRLLGPARLVGVSCHSVADVVEAADGGADFAVLGPLYATPSKAAYGTPLSPSVLREARAACSIPLIAIGGIAAATVPDVMAAGADGVAVVSAIMAAPDPTAAARELLTAWEAGGGTPAPRRPDPTRR